MYKLLKHLKQLHRLWCTLKAQYDHLFQLNNLIMYLKMIILRPKINDNNFIFAFS